MNLINLKTTHPDQDTLVLEVEVGNVELVGERHCPRGVYDVNVITMQPGEQTDRLKIYLDNRLGE